ncbi:DlpA domain-containing protein [Sodiomyces alkalinus F11]|uniref:DlpA domain-containing protein n=1 Tax=Sodiomyces alkalinus (strain CBS 110278 / VKM F-3762 / F11) TaxID=1314773 RepID=A0A3N2PQ14_SODAK|nr:DlpA domain-containing protein [Sodiomyces alkalinus F11]ROT36599.1 DlpA domain-containing protein [Sodiomyces alkalinus F11]
MSPEHPITESQLAALRKYTACDISDALLKLRVPGAGFVADLQLYSQAGGGPDGPITIAPAFTVLFVPKGTTTFDSHPSNIPKDTHWADLTRPGTAVIIQQPDGQKNAVCGGIMALRMKAREVKSIIVAGRARDLDELRSTGLPVWARALSTVGAGAASTAWAVEVPLDIDGTSVTPGDLVFSDPANGVVVIPKDKVDQVLELLPRLTAADERVKEDVLTGVSVYDAFKAHRSNL